MWMPPDGHTRITYGTGLGEKNTSDWLHNLPMGWMALVVFGATYLVAGGIYWVVMTLAVGERARAFKGLSPGMLPPLGIIFGLLVAFVAAQVWSDFEHAHTAGNREASALRAVVLLAASFPGAPEARLRTLIRRHIQETVTQEWSAMAQQHATLTMIPASLAEALQLTLGLTPRGAGQRVAQRELLIALQSALDARRQRIILSQSKVNWVKWAGLLLQAICTLLAIAMVHSDNRTTAAIALAIFATAVAVCLVLITSHDQPFTGEIFVRPEVLLQVMPEERMPVASP
jgi:Protein of unknown function (DUF4239)